LLDTLITSKTRLKLLLKFFLNPETNAYLQELGSEFGESTNGIRVELNRLTKAKLLVSAHVGRTVLYKANVDHAMFDDIRNVVQKYIGIDKLIADIVKRLGHVEAAYIISDYAKGIDSGLIDLVLVGDVKLDLLHELLAKTEKAIGRKIRSIALSQLEFIQLKRQMDIKHALLLWGMETNPK
jgi:hypothetical protein